MPPALDEGATAKIAVSVENGVRVLREENLGCPQSISAPPIKNHMAMEEDTLNSQHTEATPTNTDTQS